MRSTRKSGSALIVDSPALGSPNWLPDVPQLPELAELADEHRRLLAAKADAASRQNEVARDFEEEDRERERAYREALRSGGDPDALPPLTSPDDRKAAIKEAEGRYAAADEVLGEFLTETLDRLNGSLEEWTSRLPDVRAEAEAKRLEAEWLVIEARESLRTVAVLEAWLDRNAGMTAFAPIDWGSWKQNYRPAVEGESGASDANPPVTEAWDEGDRARRQAITDRIREEATVTHERNPLTDPGEAVAQAFGA